MPTARIYVMETGHNRAVRYFFQINRAREAVCPTGSPTVGLTEQFAIRSCGRVQSLLVMG
ncbi:hypothetical protein [Nostoc sp.]|uniref:hypothetical protein n=1 Tax=Nostoc sp. TaxID=1180 RepID=UPI002FF8C6E7